MKHVLLGALLMSWIGCASSGGTETDNPASPLQDFSSSACKTKESSPGQQTQALVLASDAEGLQCVEWETLDSGAVHLRLLNFAEPCGEQYLGRAALADDGTLELSVYKDTCDVFRCGTCVFDFDFEVAVTIDAPLALRIGSAVCASQPTSFAEELTLPIDEQSSGIVCRPLERSALEMYGRAQSSCGERNMPCGDCNTTDVTSCAVDLVCTEVTAGDSRCLVPCETDDDCVGGLTTCQAGTCQAEAGF